MLLQTFAIGHRNFWMVFPTLEIGLGNFRVALHTLEIRLRSFQVALQSLTIGHRNFRGALQTFAIGLRHFHGVLQIIAMKKAIFCTFSQFGANKTTCETDWLHIYLQLISCTIKEHQNEQGYIPGNSRSNEERNTLSHCC